MTIKKKIFFFCLTLIIFISSVIIFVDFPFVVQDSVCKKTKVHCGVVGIEKDGAWTHVNGVITKKYIKNDTYYFDFVTLDKNARAFVTILSFPPKEYKNYKVFVNLRPIGNKLSAKDLLKRYYPKEFYEMLTVPQETIVGVATPNKDELVKIKKNVPNDHYISCFDYHRSYINYIYNPKILNRMLLLASNCDLTIFSLVM